MFINGGSENNNGMSVSGLLGTAIAILFVIAIYAAIATGIAIVLAVVIYIAVYLGLYYPLRKSILRFHIEQAKVDRSPAMSARRREINDMRAAERIARLNDLRRLA